MQQEIKVKAFEYFVKQLISWYKEQNTAEDFENNDLSRLKVLKLHFFVSASKANEEEDGLLGVFNNFWAMPYGHVESDIYKSLEHLCCFKLSNEKLAILNQDLTHYFNDLDPEIKTEIEKSFEVIKDKNKELINYLAVDLVELSHSWYSWKSMYKLARSFNKYSLKIPKEIIKSEGKIFNLQSA